MILKVISAQEILFQGDVRQVTLPGTQGAFTVLHGHASLISTLTPGIITYVDSDGQQQRLDVEGGVADVDNDTVSVCIY